MALYHFHVARVLRSRGQSSVEAAAYRAGEKLEDHYYGKTADYTHKGGVICSEIMAPDYVPESFHNRETLWNAVEDVERHPKAQLAYSFDIALQNEFSLDDNIEIARRFVMENFVAKGMIADMAIHDPDKEGGIPNPHIHVMCPIRPMKEDGTWGEKQNREYLVDKNGNPILDAKGKQKYNAVPTTDWHCPEVLEGWRKAWADLVNEEFQKRVLQFIGIQSILSLFLSIDYMFSTGGIIDGKSYYSDTQVMQEELFLPYWFWGGVLLLIAIFLLILSFIKVLKNQKVNNE